MNIVEFAKVAHADQKRKYSNEPYWFHLEEVAHLCWALGEEAVLAAWLHDTLEDTQVTFDDIKNRFGILTAGRVLYLSDLTPLSEGNRAYRKNKYCTFLSTCEPLVQSVKVADLISNSISM